MPSRRLLLVLIATMSVAHALPEDGDVALNMTPPNRALGVITHEMFRQAVNNISRQVSKVNLTEVVETVVGEVEPDDLDFVFVFLGLMVMCVIFVAVSSRAFGK